jgi:hypothetical protein
MPYFFPVNKIGINVITVLCTVLHCTALYCTVRRYLGGFTAVLSVRCFKTVGINSLVTYQKEEGLDCQDL